MTVAQRRWVKTAVFAIASTLVLFLVLPVSGQQLAKRLILKDGTYQLATKWEIKGDRVRYLSAERNDWEEVPESLVDWPATSKFEEHRAAELPSADAAEVDKEAAAERAQEEARTPLVAPNLHLPENGSFFLLDTFRNQPQLVELQPNDGQVNRNRAQNMIRAAIIPIPITSNKQTIEIAGMHAAVQAHATLPSIYINLDDREAPANSTATAQQPQQSQQPQQPFDRFHIVRAQEKKGKRIVGVIKVSPLGKATRQQNLVATTWQQLTGGWVKITPTGPLEPGEYAVVELLGREGMNTYVWDFGVNPAAGANAGTINPTATTPAAQPK